jgi:predicted MarR family transcription regulator
MREAMKGDKDRERDAKPSGPMAEIVAKAQLVNQHGLDPDEFERKEREQQ